MVDLILTRDGTAYASVQAASLDLAFGEDENDYELVLPDDVAGLVSAHDVWMIDGTEYGGVVDSIQSDVADGANVVTFSGRSLQGILSHKILQPDKGQDYLKVSGTVTQVLTQIISRCGLGELFTAADNDLAVSGQFDRYTDAYTGLRKLLASHSCALVFRCGDDRVVLDATPLDDTNGTLDSGSMDFTAKREYRRTNHLIGLGEGELKDRAVSHWYADENGNVSQKQTFTGLDEVADTYEYTNADETELSEKTKEELESRQEGTGTIDVTMRGGTDHNVGDLLSAVDDVTGVSVRAAVTKKIVRIADGVLSVDYEVGQSIASSGGRSESSGGSGGGGVSYTAGEGIRIESNTISADVTEDDLAQVETLALQAHTLASDASAGVGALNTAMETKADIGHKHSAADITSGTMSTDRLPVVPISKGGTGKTTAKAANNAICGGLAQDDGSLGDTTLFAGVYQNPSDSIGGLYKRTALTVWNYVLGKIRSVLGFTTANVLPVSHGGTGATGESAARANLGVENPLATPTKLTNQNLNDYAGDGKWGSYFAAGGNTVTNKPSGVGHFGLLVIRAADGVTWQMLHDPAKNQVWIRSNDNGSWKSWTVLVRSSDKIANASNADTASSATKATQDSAGQQINATYVKSVTASGRTVTVTKGNGTSSTFQTQDTTYQTMKGATSSATGSSGLVPAPAKGAGTRYLRSDGTWQTPPNTTYQPASTSTAGLMSAADKAKLDGVDDGANAYTLPAATTSRLGGVKPDGKTITVSSDGTISAQQGGAAGFLAAHPVGSIFTTTKPGNPGSTYGGTWRELPSLGPYTWERTA